MPSVLAIFLTWMLQIMLVVGIATVAEPLLRAARPAVRLAYWRGVGLLCLALPFLASRRDAPGAVTVAADGSGVAALGQVASADLLAEMAAVLPWVLGAGIVMRLLWLYAGALRLAQLRRTSVPAMLDEDTQLLRETIAPDADVRWSDPVDQPVAFGLRRPVVLLPRCFSDLGADAQRAVACHEYLHVARRDWIAIVGEAHVRACFWYHPAVWWLLSRIDLSREQVVDQDVVRRTASRRSYMNALIAFADRTAAVAPAVTFLRRRHLHARLHQLSKESAMSTRHLIWTIAALLLALGSATTGIAKALPIALPIAASVQDGGEPVAGAQDKGVVTLPVPTHRARAYYTPEAMKAGIEGRVILEAVVGVDGRPREVRVTRSLDKEHGLDEQAIASVNEWRFTPGQRDGKPVPVLVTMEIEFMLRNVEK